MKQHLHPSPCPSENLTFTRVPLATESHFSSFILLDFAQVPDTVLKYTLNQKTCLTKQLFWSAPILN
jgi:hypothetical protein